MDFKIDKERLLRVLRGNITRVELKTGHGDSHLLEDACEGASSSPITSDSDSDVVVYTHEDMVSSLTKQLEIQRQITDICERDLQYRTEIIELLSARVFELESESVSWREQQKSFNALKEKMTYLEQLYGGDGARELEFADHHTEEPTVPDGQTLVEITYFESLKNQLERYRLDLESWRIRISTLEISLAEEKQICMASKAEYETLNREYRQSQIASSQQISILQTKFEELTDLELKASAKNEELTKSLGQANEEINRLTVDLNVAEEMRKAALMSVTAEANEYASLRGRLAELESQASITEKEKVDLQEKFDIQTKELLECRGSLSSTQSRLQECELALSSTRAELDHLQETHSQLVKSSADSLSSLEARLAGVTEAARVESADLQLKLSSLQEEKVTVEGLVSQLRGEVEQLELSGQASKTRIKELEDSRSETSTLLMGLREELSARTTEFEELKANAQTTSEQTVLDLQQQLEEKSTECAVVTEKVDVLQKQVEEKTTSLEQLELKVMIITELEEQVEQLMSEKNIISSQTAKEKEELHSKISALNAQCEQGQAQQAELQVALTKASTEATQRQSKIEALEKEAREVGGRSSIDESSLQDLYAEHERQITQMEQDYDELRIERDEIIDERDKAVDERDSHQSRCRELEKRITELENPSSPSSPFIMSPTDMTDQATIADLQARLRFAEERLRKSESAMMKRTHSGESRASHRSRDSMIIVESVDEMGRSEVRAVKRIDSDAGSDTDTASDHTADTSAMAASISMASTTSSVAELEAAKARAEQAEREVRRLNSLLQNKQGEDQDKHSKKPSRNDSVRSHRSSSSSFSIANALSGASRMVGSIGHSEGSHLFPELTRKSSETQRHHEENEHHHHDISNPFLLFARDRKDSTRSRHSLSASTSGSISGHVNVGTPTSPSPSTSTTDPSSAKDPTSPTRSALEREKKAREKAEKIERERLEKVAKIELEKARKAEKTAKREKERLEREEKEKARKERLKADPNGLASLTALRQGAGSYYENN
ncbi:hypothetical protein FS842_001927 [Serendipita sp. 407]|nr:hypothetical protein FS842_001927 [Serendipita sp. 407]